MSNLPNNPKSTLHPKRILVMRYRFIGDTVLTVPFLHNLRLAYPEAKIDVLVGPQSGKVLEGCPHLNELITYDTTRFHKYDSGQEKPRNFWSYVCELRHRKYDTVFVLKRSLGANLLAWLIGAKYRIGYNTQLKGILLTHPVKWEANIHEVESLLSVLQAVDISCPSKSIDMWITSSEVAKLQQRIPELKTAKLPVLFHAAAAHPNKMMPLENWAQIIKYFHQKTGLTPFFTGAAQDKKLYENLTELIQIPVINLAGQLSLRESLVLYSQMKLAICVDSGPAHLASAAGIPTFSIFGPTDPKRWKPWEYGFAIHDPNLPNLYCTYHKDCNNPYCLAKIPPQTVINSIDACLPLIPSFLMS